VASPESNASQYESYAYTKNGNPAKLPAPPDPGTYEVRYILGQDSKLLAKAPITVTPVSATVSAPAEVAVEAKFQVEWQGPGYSGDYVAIAVPEASESQYESYVYTKTGTPVSLKAPSKPGTYEVRYVMDRGRKILSKTRITVK
jgi:Ca-activated chloride channel family protein